MGKDLLALVGASLCCFSLCAETVDDDLIAKIESEILTRADGLPQANFADATDPYLEGYIQALIDVHYYEYQVVVIVKDHKVLLANLPNNDLLSKSIISFVKDLPGVRSVEMTEVTKQELEMRKEYVEQPRVSGVWFLNRLCCLLLLWLIQGNRRTQRRCDLVIRCAEMYALPCLLVMIFLFFAGLM